MELLASAYSLYHSIGYAWRAAAAALRLHAVTDDVTWLRLAGEAVAEFSESSVARDIRRRDGGEEDARLAALTPAQRRVFELICEGLSDKQIAHASASRPRPSRTTRRACASHSAFIPDPR